MKIVMLNGQNHKGSTYNIGRIIAEKIEGENEITEFFFPRDLNHFCAGCYKCIEDVSLCPFYSEKKKIIDAIDVADVLIVTTPTYCMHMSAPLKSFFDLTFDMWMSHRPMKSMFSKKAVIVSTSAGAGAKSAMKDVEDCLFYMGVPKIIKYGIAVQAMNWDGVATDKKNIIDKKTNVIAKKLSSKRNPSVGIKTRFMFHIMGMIQKKGWNSSPVETEYWKEKGWLDGKKPWKMKYKLVIFDMDGTILDTLNDLTNSLNYALEKAGFPKRTRKEVRSFVGNGIQKLVERGVPIGISNEVTESVLSDFTQYYEKHCTDNTKPYDGIVDLIQNLKEKGYLTAVVSNKADFAVQELSKKYFADLFDAVVGEKCGVRKKPSPDTVNQVLMLLNINRSEAVYIGDSEVDIETAKNAEMGCISVDWGFRDHEELIQNGATTILSRPLDILSII